MIILTGETLEIISKNIQIVVALNRIKWKIFIITLEVDFTMNIKCTSINRMLYFIWSATNMHSGDNNTT